MEKQPYEKKVLFGILISIILLGGLLLFYPLFKELFIDKKNFFLVSRLLLWVCLLIIYVYVNKVEKQKFFLWTESKFSVSEYFKSFFIIISSIFIGAVIIGLSLKFLGSNVKNDKINEITKMIKNDFLFLTFICFTAAIVEEFIFRGYLLPRLQLFFRNKYVPIVISSLIFGFLHFGYGTIIQILGPLFIGFVFAIHYEKYRNIKILIFCHFFWDFATLFLKTHLK